MQRDNLIYDWNAEGENPSQPTRKIQLNDESLRDGLQSPSAKTPSIDEMIEHLHNCADLRCFEDFHRDCPNARKAAQSVVLLPTYPRYSSRDVELNIASIRRYFGRG